VDNGGVGWKLLQGDNVGPNVALSGQNVLQASHDWCRYARAQSRELCPEAGRSFVPFVECVCVLACRRGREFDLVQLLDSEIGRRGVSGFDTAGLLDRFPPSVSFGEWYRSLINVPRFIVAQWFERALMVSSRRYAGGPPNCADLFYLKVLHCAPPDMCGSHPPFRPTNSSNRWSSATVTTSH
jgi:hypothetical protein